MARRKTEGPRVLGPYANRAGFRIIHVKKNGTREARVFETEALALAEKERLLAICQLKETTLREAMNAYLTYMREEKGNKERSVDQTKRKLWRFFPDLEVGLTELDQGTCAGYYDALRKSHRKPQKRPADPAAPPTTPLVSVDYHRNTLSEARTFLNWCIKKQWIVANPLDGVEGVGRRNHGKEQLRIDEARKWIARAMELADRKQESGAIAAMMTLVMGMRCREIVERVVRDVDDEGRLLWIPDSKTAKGRRTLLVPEVLRTHLLRLTKDRHPTEPLFGNVDGKPFDRAWPRKWVQRICADVDVPIVTAHGQRGLHSTLAVEAGMSSRAVADALGHESFSTTAQSYAKPEAVGAAKQARALKVLDGGKAQVLPPTRRQKAVA